MVVSFRVDVSDDLDPELEVV
jgi:hypothetical protein